ncbi:hypothetical protein [Terriglobus albidus]|uniref:hypothetical protein n=1 Tax=Terriglobus albidus TaxID=1592106 RepID=UPI0021E03866|nr:hypothetical protein [Terriglobus albidus]
MDHTIGKEEALILLSKYTEENTLLKANLSSVDKRIQVSLIGTIYQTENEDLVIAGPNKDEDSARVDFIVVAMNSIVLAGYHELKDVAELSEQEREDFSESHGFAQLRFILDTGWTLSIFEPTG